MRKFFAFFFVLTCPLFLKAEQDFDPATIEALVKTQVLLTNKIEREAALKNNSAGKAADQKVKDLAGSEEISEEIYKLTADVFAELVKSTNGNPEKMLQSVEKGEKNPEEFTRLFTPELLKRLHEIAGKISKGKP